MNKTFLLELYENKHAESFSCPQENNFSMTGSQTRAFLIYIIIDVTRVV